MCVCVCGALCVCVHVLRMSLCVYVHSCFSIDGFLCLLPSQSHTLPGNAAAARYCIYAALLFYAVLRDDDDDDCLRRLPK